MTASAGQPRVRGERRIIERPRLIKLLDETDARTILLLAPAGYGKTTLARQWAKTLRGAVWVTLTPAHRDVAYLAQDLARVATGADSDSTRFIAEQVRARLNPQRAPRELGAAVASALNAARISWLLVDDYHEISSAPAAEELAETLEQQLRGRLLVATRVRPMWTSGRRVVYGEILEVTRSDLAMTDAEVTEVVGKKPSARQLSEQARGWPAVVGLAAAVDDPSVPQGALPDTLHRYLAEELFQRASTELQQALFELALRSPRSTTLPPDERWPDLAAEADGLGFTSEDTGFELHPLLQDFLLEKLAALPDADERVRAAVAAHIEAEAWDLALALVLRFDLLDTVDQTLSIAFGPLVRSGRLATLATFAQAMHSKVAAPSVQITLAEAAFRDGNLELTIDLAQAVQPNLSRDHPLASRTAALLGHAAFLKADFPAADAAFRDARETATDERDLADARYGLALARIFGEQTGARKSVHALAAARHRSSVDFLRFAASEIALRLVGGTRDGLSANLHLDAIRQLLPGAEDPRVRTNATYTVASALSQRGEYAAAREWLKEFFEDAEAFGLDFAVPYATWTLAQVAIGQRRFGEAERALQALEDHAARSSERHHELNARALRARLLLQNGQPDAAARCVAADPDIPLIPSWSGEYLATRALALACVGNRQEAEETADAARGASSALQVQGLALAARAIVVATNSEPGQEPTRLIRVAQRLEVWDPVVCALRSSLSFADRLSADDELRPALERLYRKIGDSALARRAGFRTRATASPIEVLSPREYEILGLIARGYKNGDIAKALFIGVSTTKVHVRHIFEKLGVRTRAEAAARLQMFEG